MRTLSLLVGFLFGLCTQAQNTLGVLNYDPARTQDGYNLYYPSSQGTVWLLDNCGRIVHQWADTLTNPGNSAYLLENGQMMRTGKANGTTNPTFPGGGGGQFVELKDANNNVLWHYEYSSLNYRMHHDLAYMPNGNVLIVAWEMRDSLEILQAGRDMALTSNAELWPDHIVEVEPTGATTGSIVWEWHAWDHLIQDFDPNVDNFGVVADHPELIDVNHANNTLGGDWMHVNAIDYNETLDQIVMSVPYFNELWIIDHSTTTAEATSHTGGNSGMGGDLIYRWGNPINYGHGDSLDQQLFFQHDVHWMDIGLDANDPDFGKIMLFNNRLPGAFSEVLVLEPPVDGFNYTLDAGEAYGPELPEWTYRAPVETDLFSSGLAGVQKMPNGNVLICSGRQGWTFEVDPDDNDAVVWDFEGPIIGGNPGLEGTIPGLSGNSYFRMNRYAPDFPGLIGLDLVPQDYIELEPDLNFCDSSLTVGINSTELLDIYLYPNPCTNELNLLSHFQDEFYIYDGIGQEVLTGALRNMNNKLDINGLLPGFYTVRTTRGISANFVKM